MKFWDADWKPNGDYCLLAAEYHGTAYKYDGTNVTYLGGPNGSDTSIVDWKPDGTYGVFSGDLGAAWEWPENSGFTNISSTFPSSNGLLELDWNPDGTEAFLGETEAKVWKYKNNGIQLGLSRIR